MCAAFLDLESVIPSQRHLRRIRQAATSESVNTRNRAPTSSHTCVSRLFGEVDWKQAPRTSSLPSVPPNWPSAGTGVSPGPEGNPGGNLVRGKSKEERRKTAKEEIDGKFNFVTRFKPQFKSADIFHVVLLDDLVVET